MKEKNGIETCWCVRLSSTGLDSYGAGSGIDRDWSSEEGRRVANQSTYRSCDRVSGEENVVLLVTGAVERLMSNFNGCARANSGEGR